MDAAAHLKKLGWRGAGHSLDLADKGLKKPLLVAKKKDYLGVGQKSLVSDQWWMRAFDESLKQLGTGTSVCD
jgi:nucleolar protein TMA23